MNNKQYGWIHGIALIICWGMGCLWYHEKIQEISILLAAVLIASIYITSGFLLRFRANQAKIFIPIAYLIAISWLMLLRLNHLWAWRQLCWMVLGLIIMGIVMTVMNRIPKQPVLKAQYIWFGITIVLLVLPLLIGVTKGGATSWIMVGPVSFQPSELAKITFLLYMVSWYKNNHVLTIGRISSLLVSVLVVLSILVIQIDLGTALIFYSIFIIIMYLATGKRQWAIMGLVCLVIAGIGAYVTFGHVQIRVETWIDPWAQPLHGGYQLIQSLSAFASGGWFGTGIGSGKPYLIPAAHTDFIFSVIGEQMGFIGCLSIVMAYVCYMVMACRSMVAIKTKGSFLLASGLIFFILAQSMIILGGVTKLIPLTGITLPFVSYGGSSLVTLFAAIGIVFGIMEEQGKVVPIQEKKLKKITIASLLVYGMILLNLFYWQIINGENVLLRALELL